MRRLMRIILAAIFWAMLAQQSAFATGALFVRPLRSNQTYQTIWIKTYDASVAIQDQIAVTHVDQICFNETNDIVEATYIFPLPEGAVITELVYWLNGQRFVASIRERQAAQQAYDDRIRQLIDPALLQYLGDNLFKLNIAPINPKTDVRFEITYAELLAYEFGNVDYRFFLRTTGLSPRPRPKSSSPSPRPATPTPPARRSRKFLRANMKLFSAMRISRPTATFCCASKPSASRLT